MKKIFAVIISMILILGGIMGCNEVEKKKDIEEGYNYNVEVKQYNNSKNIYVNAQDGNDTNDGYSENKAVKTIDKAKEIVKSLRESKIKNDSIKVNLKGAFYLQDKIEFSTEDGGELPVIYDGGNSTTLSGAKVFKGGFELYRNGIYRKNIGQINFREIYVNDIPGVMARYPNISERVEDGVMPTVWRETDNGVNKRDFGIDTSKLGKINSDNLNGSAELVFLQEWVFYITKIQKSENKLGKTYFQVDKTNTDVMWSKDFPSRAVGTTFTYLQNSLNLLDAENEWYYDKKSGDLYYKPKSGTNINSLEFKIPVSETIIFVNGRKDNPIKNITIQNLRVECSTWTYPNEHGFNDIQSLQYYPGHTNFWYHPPGAVEVRWAENFNFYHNVVTNTAMTGVDIRYGVKNAVIKANKLYNIGGNGISLGFLNEKNENFNDGEFTRRYDVFSKTNVPYVTTDIYVQNNYIKTTGLFYNSGTGILGGHFKNAYINNNELDDIPYSGIAIGFTWDTVNKQTVSGNIQVRRNKITNIVNSVLVDGAAIYFLGPRDDTLPISECNENYIKSNKNAKIYYDMMSNYMKADSNVLEGSDRYGALHLHDYEKLLKDINITNHYTETKKNWIVDYPKYSGKTLKERNVNMPTNIVKDVVNDWPEEAYKIIEQAGIMTEYSSIKTL